MAINSTDWMNRTQALRATGLAPAAALAAAYEDLTGQKYADFRAACRAGLKAASEVAYRIHCERAERQGLWR
jgi:hypothetical protein